MKNFATFTLLLSLSLIFLSGCLAKQTFTPLPNSPSVISITRYDRSYKNAETVILKGKEKNQLLSELNNAGKHMIPKNAVFHCGSASGETIVYRDIIIHYEQGTDRFFEMNTEGCTFLTDIKDGIGLNPSPMPNLKKYFK